MPDLMGGAPRRRRDWRSDMDVPGGIPTAGSVPIDLMSEETLSPGPAPTGREKVFDVAYGLLGGTPDKRSMAEGLTKAFDAATLGMATGAYDGASHLARTGEIAPLALGLMPAGKVAAPVREAVAISKLAAPERAKAVLDRASGMPGFAPGFSMRGLIDPQMRTPGYVPNEPFDLNSVSLVGRETMPVPLKDIKSQQKRISVRAAKSKIDNPASDDGRPPSVFEWDGRYYVNDGNHRIAAARALGNDTVDAEVIRLAPRGAQAARSSDAPSQSLGVEADRTAQGEALTLGASPTEVSKKKIRNRALWAVPAGGVGMGLLGDYPNGQ